MFAYWSTFIISSLIGLLLIKPVGAQTVGGNQLSSLTKELDAPLQAQKATPAQSDTAVVLGNVKDNRTVLQYVLSVPYSGWNTVVINLSGQLQTSTLIDPDLLKEYGCQLEAKRILQRGQRKIIIDAFQFATADGAYGSYCAGRRGSSSYATQGDASSEDQNSISFCKDGYFICLQSSEQDDDEAKSVVNTLAKKIIEYIDQSKKGMSGNNSGTAQILPYNPKPAVFNAMPSFGRVLGSEKLIAGPASLKRFFPAPYSVSLAPLLKGAVADFKLEEPHRDRLKLLIAYYPTAQEANMTYAKYSGTLGSEHDEKSVDGFTYPTSLFKVSDCFILCQLRDKQVIIINGARHKDTLSALAHQIYF